MGRRLPQRNRTLEEQFRVWQLSRYDRKPATRKKDEWIWRRWLQPRLANRKIGSIGPEDLEQVLADVSASGAGPSTRIAVYQALNMMLDQALGGQGHACREVTVGADQRKRPIRVLTDDQVVALIDATPPPHQLLVDFLATMGVRPGEALSLRKADFQASEVTVRSSKRTGAGGNGYRVMPMPKHLAERMNVHLGTIESDEPVFGVADLRSWRRRVFSPAAERAGLEGLVPYDLRHTCASKLISRQATPTDVATWLGHSVAMTLTVYSHLFPGRKKELSAILDRSPTP